ncbi:MAG TPA: hypothetical protein VH877_31610 [Polyangia bacterium]|nr:hypothetical protein [Polyangia bacterium]
MRGAESAEIYNALVQQDMRRATELLRPVWEARDHRDGLVMPRRRAASTLRAADH